VKNPAGVNRGVKHITLDGNTLNGNAIPLLDDGGRHEVNVVLGVVVTTS
jgi:cellobiose phosphorylase